MTVVATNAALAQVTVSQQVYEKDILLQWVCQVASPLQLTVKIVDDKAASTLQLEAQNVILHQRNTILRALCGIALCNALDQKPFYLLAGGSASPIVIGKIVHWMSVADSLRSSSVADNADDDTTFLVDLEQQLQDSAFLMASSQASLADMDLALVLANQEIDAVYTNVLRWRETVLNTMRLLLANKTVVIPAVPSVSPVTPPIFFNGTEDVSTILQPKKKVTATKKNDSSSTSSQPQPSQDKQQQQQQPKPTDKKQTAKKAKVVAAARLQKQQNFPFRPWIFEWEKSSRPGTIQKPKSCFVKKSIWGRKHVKLPRVCEPFTRRKTYRIVTCWSCAI
jgi:hypothetical protein